MSKRVADCPGVTVCEKCDYQLRGQCSCTWECKTTEHGGREACRSVPSIAGNNPKCIDDV